MIMSALTGGAYAHMNNGQFDHCTLDDPEGRTKSGI